MDSRLARHLARLVTVACTALLVALPAAAQDGESPRPMTSVRGAPIGAEVTITVRDGLVPGRTVNVGFGGLSGGFEFVARGATGPDGSLSVTATVPAWAERDLVYYFFLNLGGNVRVFSDPFVVTFAEGVLRARGSVAEVAEGCMVIAAADQTRFALSGVTTRFPVGAVITVDGTVGDAEDAPEDSPCAGGPAIPVRVHGVRVG